VWKSTCAIGKKHGTQWRDWNKRQNNNNTFYATMASPYEGKFFYKEPVVFIIAGVLGRGGKEEQKRIQHVVKQFVDFCACEVAVLHRVYLRTSPQHFSPSRNLNNLKRRKPFILIKV
jgi:hypothetical protein